MGRGFFFNAPALDWNEGLPLGNGRLGAMFLSAPERETIHLNEESLWSGHPRDSADAEVRPHLDRVRALVREGRYREAQDIAERSLQGRNPAAYQPLGVIEIGTAESGAAPAEFSRSLDIEDGLLAVECRSGGSSSRRAAFASAADGLIAFRWETSRGALPVLALSFSSPHPSRPTFFDGNSLSFHGRLPSYVGENYSRDHPHIVLYEEERTIEFSCRVRILAEGGACREGTMGDRPALIAEGARAVTVLIAIASNFRSWDAWPVPGESGPMDSCAEAIERGMALGWNALLERHAEEHRSVMGRVSLRLGPEDAEAESLPIDERVKRYREGQRDHGLEELMLRYGRYLLAASSRKCRLPANLQGIWNPMVRPPWFCEYTLNVNAGMNYWMAEAWALGDCHEALIDFALGLSEAGARTALLNYGCRGSTAHHNTDIWRLSCAALGDASWSLWPMGLSILVRHAWERWTFSCDRIYLAEKAWPIIRGTALFILDWLVEEEDGRLGTNPSTSPENAFIDDRGERCAVTASSAMDLSLAREVLDIAIRAARELAASGTETPALGAEAKAVSDEALKAMKRLKPLGIGKDGRILEWGHEAVEAEPGHRHFSQLYALYPGRAIGESDGPLLQACKRTLAERLKNGSGSTGWSAAWAACLSARLGDAETAYSMLRRIIGEFTLPNLLGTHPPFQIDANFGYCAGMAEMLVTRGDGWIRLLPALPSAWRAGEVRGMRLPGGIDLGMEWKDGGLARADLKADYDIDVRIEYGKSRIGISMKAGETLILNADLVASMIR